MTANPGPAMSRGKGWQLQCGSTPAAAGLAGAQQAQRGTGLCPQYLQAT